MRRRYLLRGVVAGVAGLAGCSTGYGGSGVRNTTETPPGSVPSDVEERVVACEREYLAARIATDDNESVTDRSGPVVVESEPRADGAYVEVETQIGTVRSRGGEPDEHADYLVTAVYLVTDGETFRTEGFDAEGGPRDGTTVDC